MVRDGQKDLSWYRVALKKNGKIDSIRRVEGPSDDDNLVYYIRAASLDAAEREVYNRYARIKLREKRAKYKAEGRCRCGRERGGNFAMCSVCLERSSAARKKYPGKNGVKGAPRDEEARVASNQARQRDRRRELRLEALLEVREAWMKSPSVAVFGHWLSEQIKDALNKVPGHEPNDGPQAGDKRDIIAEAKRELRTLGGVSSRSQTLR